MMFDQIINYINHFELFKSYTVNGFE